MQHSPFTVPRLLGFGHRRNVWPPDHPHASDLDDLVSSWSGLLRGCVLMGHRVVEITLEQAPVTASQRTLLDVPALVAYDAVLPPTGGVDDGLDGVRAMAPTVLATIRLEPLHLFGDRGGPPLALDLPVDDLASLPDVHVHLSAEGVAWIGVTSDSSGWGAAMGDLADKGPEISEAFVPVLVQSWHRAPTPAGPPAGLSWVLRASSWSFPPATADTPSRSARLLDSGLGLLETTLSSATDIETFVREQIVTGQDPTFWDRQGSFSRVSRQLTGYLPGGVIEAYRDRVGLLTQVEPDEVRATAQVLADRFMWVDAVLVMAQHGAIGVIQQVVGGHPETADAPDTVFWRDREWTATALTGQWDVDSVPPGRLPTDTLLLNQAGSLISGYWQHRILSGDQGLLQRYVLLGQMTSGSALDGQVTYEVTLWQQPEGAVWLTDTPSLGETCGTATLTVDAGALSRGSAQLLLDATVTCVHQVSGEYRFIPSPEMSGAHHTEFTLSGLSEAGKAQARAVRDAPLHYVEADIVDTLADVVVDYVVDFLENAYDAGDVAPLVAAFDEAVGDVSGMTALAAFDELLPALRRRIQATLEQLRPPGAASYWTVLESMLRLTPTLSADLQRIFGIQVYDGNVYYYQWKITNIDAAGGGLGVVRSVGTGTFHIRRVEVVEQNGETTTVPVGPEVTKPVDLAVTDVGSVLDIPTTEDVKEWRRTTKATDLATFGPDDMESWNHLGPSGYDVIPVLDGATLSTMGFGGSWLVLESSGTAEVWLAPPGDRPTVTGRIDPSFSGPTLPAIDADTTDLNEIKEKAGKWKDLIETGKEVREKYGAKGVKGLKKVKKLRPELKMTTMSVWFPDASGASTMPDTAPVDAGSYADEGGATWFDTGSYELDGPSRGLLRWFCLLNLPLLTGLNEMIIEGNASPRATTEEFNISLSRDRAMSVLTAIADILGPQLATPPGSLLIRGLGSSRSANEPDSNVEWDRRVDVHLLGQIRLRSA